MLAAGYDTLPPTMQEAVIDYFDVNEAWLVRVLEGGVESGELVLSGSPPEAAQAIVSGLEGAMLIARPYDDVRRFDSAASRLLASLVRDAPAPVPNR
jgi:TetR/AcrR family transcriptional repressor of nem operon